jgi:hypothetical protein
MHKKSEVELRVAQELKNHQDFIYQTNQSLQNLNQGILNISNAMEKVRAASEQRCKEIEIAFENLVVKLDQRYAAIDKRLTNFERDIIFMVHANQSIVSSLRDKCSDFDHFKKDSHAHHDLVDSILVDLSKGVKDQASSLEKVTSLTKQEVDAIRNDLSPKGPSAESVKKAIEEILSIMRVDLDGIIKELNLIKKSQAYDGKKIENLYTLIERLKGAS